MKTVTLADLEAKLATARAALEAAGERWDATQSHADYETWAKWTKRIDNIKAKIERATR
jgi:hypothetical protein